ncbi:MAG: flagellin [Pseudomonadota bacterium]|nr:flagellin [Pseudomonadota bacterium]
MTAILNTNLAGLQAQRLLAATQAAEARTLARLASGQRINGASDDAAGLAISERMLAQVRGLTVAGRNAQDAISLAQTAEGSLGTIGGNLQRLRELAVQAANATNSNSDRAALQLEASQLLQEIDRVAAQTSFNGLALLNGSFGASVFQVGASGGLGQTVTLAALSSARTSALGAIAGAGPPPVTTTTATGSGLSAFSVINGAGQLVINGVDVYQGAPIADDAHLIAAAISAAGISGLSAVANPLQLAGTYADVGSGVTELFSFPLVSCGVGLVGTRADVTTLVNFVNGTIGPMYVAGLTAFDNGLGATLVQADGHNIVMSSTGGLSGIGLAGIPADGSASLVTSRSTYSISYTGTAGLTIAGSRAAALGLTPMTPLPPPAAGGSPGIGSIDIGTVGGANAALASLDLAIASVDAGRAALGAVQNRFRSAIGNIDTASENTRAARSRIVDADYAAESTALARAQILGSAGLAMVAQANASRRSVLTLLRRTD